MIGKDRNNKENIENTLKRKRDRDRPGESYSEVQEKLFY